MRNYKKYSQRSYTLVELIVVISIMGILMGVGLPAFMKMMKGSGVSLGASNISSKLKAARGYAIAKRKRVAVVFKEDPASSGIWKYQAVFVDNNSTSPTQTGDVPGESWLKIPNGTLLDTSGIAATVGGNRAIIFKPTGSATSGDTLTIQEAGSSTTTNKLTITINLFTGRPSF